MSDDAARHDVAAGDGEVEGIVVQMSVQIALPRRRRAECRRRAREVAGVERRRNAAENDVGIVCARHRDVAHPSRGRTVQTADSTAVEDIAVRADVGAIICSIDSDAADNEVAVVCLSVVTDKTGDAAEVHVAAALQSDAAVPSDVDVEQLGVDGVAHLSDSADIDAHGAVDEIVTNELAAAADDDLQVLYRGFVDRDKFAVDVVSCAALFIGRAALQIAFQITGYRDGMVATVQRRLGRGEDDAVGIGAHGQVARNHRRRRACRDSLVRAGMIFKSRAERVAAEEEVERVLRGRLVAVALTLVEVDRIVVAQRDCLGIVFGIDRIVVYRRQLRRGARYGDVVKEPFFKYARRDLYIYKTSVGDRRGHAVVEVIVGGGRQIVRICRRVESGHKVAGKRVVRHRAVVVGHRRGDIQIGRVLRDDRIAADHSRPDVAFAGRRAV